MTIGTATGEPLSVTNTNAAAVEGDAGTTQNGWEATGDMVGIRAVSRADAIGKVKKSPVRAIVQVGVEVEECSGAGGMHVTFVVPEAWGAKPFVAAKIGGHGVYFERGQFPAGQLYIAGVRVGQPYTWPADSGWCLGEIGTTDAGVEALVPVRDLGEGLRLLGRM